MKFSLKIDFLVNIQTSVKIKILVKMKFSSKIEISIEDLGQKSKLSKLKFCSIRKNFFAKSRNSGQNLNCRKK